jgi:hypothetical protein
MRRRKVFTVILAAILTVAGYSTSLYAQSRGGQFASTEAIPKMNKADVVSLSKAGVNDKMLISMLTISHSRFDLKSEDVVDLKNAGVSEKVIDAMIDERSSSANSSQPAHWRYYSFQPNWY